MLSAIKGLFDENLKKLRRYQKIVTEINSLEADIKKLSDAKLAAKTAEFKDRLSNGQTLDQLLPEAFAVVREATFRTLHERAYDVQLLAAITLHYGDIAEQKTGEGKTHSVIFPAYLNALSGLGVHIITPNDYLTKVGTGWYPQALSRLGITVAGIVHEKSYILDEGYTDTEEKFDSRLTHLRPISRQEAYQADITYGTNNEFGFDYLRDHMVSRLEQKVQRGHNFAVVDEVDFVLIDEARTPLIISSPSQKPIGKYTEYAQLVDKLQPTDFTIEEKSRSASLSEYGLRKVEQILKVPNLYEQSFETIHYIENAIKAKNLYIRDKDYIVKDNEVIIVDEFTGRLMPGRRWSDGLHQAIEAKEGVTIQQESQTWATITFQNYFRLYSKLAGMTGTASTEAEEFEKIYHLDVLPIPTHLPVHRQDRPDLIFKNQRAKYAAIVALVEERNRLGQPVLIGTTSIEKNQVISALLHKKGIVHQVLNAKNHQTEAEIISLAGQKGSVTVATNMAGRGVDIILGGPKELKKSPEVWQADHQAVVNLGGLCVIGTERHESRRIDNQLRGRAGRQGDPGSSQFFIALDDDLMRIFGGDRISGLMTRFDMPEDVPLAHPLVTRVIEQIQVKVEGFNFDTRKNVVEYDDVINKQRQIVYELRDQTLANSKTIEKLQEQFHKIISHESDRLSLLASSAITDTIDYQPLANELAEYFPESDTASRVLSDLRNQPPADIRSYISDIFTSRWQQRSDYFGPDLSAGMLSYVILSTIDHLWVDHLTALDNLRNGVRLRGYAQRDPLIEYRKEGFEMFQKMMAQFESNFLRQIFRLEPVPINQTKPTPAPARLEETRGQVSDYVATPTDTASETPVPTAPRQPATSQSLLGRNDPCWCGSGKKFKKCHYPNYS